MRDTLKNEPNTIWKSFKFMNTMMGDAIKMGGIIDKNPFEAFDRGSCGTGIVWLAEIRTLGTMAGSTCIRI